MSSSSDPSDLINTTTILALGAILFITAGTYILSLSLLPSSTPTRIRTLFLWQTFDFAIHFFIEAPFLYTCFFTSAPLSSLKPQTPPLYNPFFPNFSLGTPRSETPYFPATPPNVYFLGRKDHAHGAYYGTTWAAKLWQEYAKADKRWGGADLGVVSLEILTVGLMAPLGVWICVLLWRAGKAKLRADTVRAKALERSAWFWGLVVATGELYGGFMTFAPEWLTGSPNLDTSNWMYMWLYLFFFNTLWVWLPLWVMWEGYREFTSIETADANGRVRKETKKSK